MAIANILHLLESLCDLSSPIYNLPTFSLNS